MGGEHGWIAWVTSMASMFVIVLNPKCKLIELKYAITDSYYHQY